MHTSHIETNVHQAVTDPGAHAKRNILVRLVTDWDFAVRAMRYALRMPTPLHTEDRSVLEQVIFRYYASLPEVKRVLFVGCQWYTSHYGRRFFPQHDYWTIEPDEKWRKHGGRQHIVAPLEDLDTHFPPDYFDLILCNGVYGFGLDGLEQCERAFAHCHSRLRDNGHLVLGWNNVPARTPLPLDSIESLKRFRKFTFPAFGSWRYRTQTPYAHTYDFYVK